MSVGGNLHNPQWPKDQVNWISQNLDKYTSFSSLTDDFNETFRTNRNYTAMISKCRRLGLHSASMSTGGGAHQQWPKDQVDWLSDNFNQCVSFMQMTNTFNETFHTSRSRSAMIGKCDRMGLHDPGCGPKPVRRYPPKKPRVQRKQYKRSRPVQQPQQRPESKYDCAWPGSEPCSRKASIGPYCEAHAKLAYRQMPAERRIKQLMYH